MKKILSLLIASCSCIFIACSLDNSQKADASSTTLDDDEIAEPDVGRYVYIDETGCLHTDRHCRFLRDSANYRVHFIETKQLAGNPDSFCSYCVRDHAFDKIEKIIYENNQRHSGEIQPDSVAYEGT